MSENAITEKMQDLDIVGYEVEFDPEEADTLGAFREDALTKDEALDATEDLFSR